MASAHLAQLNIGRLRFPQGAPEVREFIANLMPINALADRSPGFVWRFEAEAAGMLIPSIVGVDPLDVVNMSVWESFEDLYAFTYDSDHARFMRKRRKWFEVPAEAFSVMWWVPVGHRPDMAEALDRLQSLRESGPGPDAFSTSKRFDQDGQPIG